jgi:DNA excision repair protein ERCC-6
MNGEFFESDYDSESETLTRRKKSIRRRDTGLDGLIKKIVQKGHVLVTTYASLRIYEDILLPIKWAYTILDEGHQIRNPDADITIICKKLKTCHRIVLTGTPIQNNLTELWSLYDFVYPGKLGTLPVFKTQFAIPIAIGGYANANNVQVQTAYKCACILRDFISPYMLRRMKVDVAQELPKKNEQVLFCKLTPAQRKIYKRYLESDDVGKILTGNLHVLSGIDILRKICNHPDLLEYEQNVHDHGAIEKSGKMMVVNSLLKMWKSQNHRVLLFCQTRQMLNIMERMVREMQVSYFRMDGNTPIKSRAELVDRFNKDESIFLFLLTTKVGGLGVNLTGASRLIIYDPDWNPSTDMQARERCWRLGQTKNVTIYRLMTSGTVTNSHQD